MKNIRQVTLALIIAGGIFMYGCGPNDDKGSMDQENSQKEGEVDSTKIPQFDSSHASLSIPAFLLTSDTANTGSEM